MCNPSLPGNRIFWDKLERANYILEAVIETAHRPSGDRVVAWLLQQPLGDGGQWDMFVSLVRKHGAAPKSAMPETESSGNSMRMNAALNYQVRQGARNIRSCCAREAGTMTMRQAGTETLQSVYQILSIHLGAPPARFDWQWKDKDGNFHRDGWLPPSSSPESISTPPWMTTSAWSTPPGPATRRAVPIPFNTWAAWLTAPPSNT